jgi:putative tricarboxylic transport membrane protein
VVATGLALASLALIRDGIRSGEAAFGLRPGVRGVPLPFATTVACLFFYYFLSERLGFIVCSALVLAALLWTYGVRRRLVVPIALIATLVIHTGFFKLLKVPLPWGVLQPLAW